VADPDEKNAHHRLDEMARVGASSQAEADYLADVAAYAGAQAQPARDAGRELPAEIGPRVKAVREQARLTLDDVAGRTGLDLDTLKSIEAGEYDPPLGMLIRLAKALDMSMGTFITTGEDKPYAVLRAADRRVVSRFSGEKQERYGYTYMPLAPDKRNRSMEPFLVTLTPSGGDHKLSDHDGQEFIFVLTGALEVRFAGEKFVLEPGDAIYYDSTTPHLVTTHGDLETTILAVLYAANK
jgi:transcriptional regulator with XRE-family HTH domain